MPILDGRLLLLANCVVVEMGGVTGPISLRSGWLQQGGKQRPPIGSVHGDLFPLNHHLVTGVGKNGGGVCDTGLPSVCTYLYLLCPQIERC